MRCFPLTVLPWNWLSNCAEWTNKSRQCETYIRMNTSKWQIALLDFNHSYVRRLPAYSVAIRYIIRCCSVGRVTQWEKDSVMTQSFQILGTLCSQELHWGAFHFEFPRKPKDKPEKHLCWPLLPVNYLKLIQKTVVYIITEKKTCLLSLSFVQREMSHYFLCWCLLWFITHSETDADRICILCETGRSSHMVIMYVCLHGVNLRINGVHICTNYTYVLFFYLLFLILFLITVTYSSSTMLLFFLVSFIISIHSVYLSSLWFL